MKLLVSIPYCIFCLECTDHTHTCIAHLHAIVDHTYTLSPNGLNLYTTNYCLSMASSWQTEGLTMRCCSAITQCNDEMQ